MTAMPEFATLDEALSWMLAEVDDPCVNNVRSALRDDPGAVAKYQRTAVEGCCGSFDAEVLVAGRVTLVGCNYGH